MNSEALGEPEAPDIVPKDNRYRQKKHTSSIHDEDCFESPDLMQARTDCPTRQEIVQRCTSPRLGERDTFTFGKGSQRLPNAEKEHCKSCGIDAKEGGLTHPAVGTIFDRFDESFARVTRLRPLAEHRPFPGGNSRSRASAQVRGASSVNEVDSKTAFVRREIFRRF